MHPLINIALTAARDSAAALAHKVERLDRIRVVDSNPLSFTTSADIESDETLRYHISKAYPEHSIDSRVSGLHEGAKGEPVWLLDPLVGSINYATGYLRFGVAVAVQRRGAVEQAVFVAPMQTDEVIASKGKGAQLNSRRARANGDDLRGSLIGLDDTGVDSQLFLGFQAALMDEGAGVRIGGHGALDVVDVACGKLQGGWCHRRSTHALAAANFILLEAGGLVGSETGDARMDSARAQVFGAPRLFKRLVKLRRGVDA